MGRDHFMISATNPNERSGGGGCLCSPAKLADARGPYIVFTGVETDSAFSPYAVLCADCACNAACKAGVTESAHGCLSEAAPPADGVPQADHDDALQRLHDAETLADDTSDALLRVHNALEAANAHIAELKAAKPKATKKAAAPAASAELF